MKRYAFSAVLALLFTACGAASQPQEKMLPPVDYVTTLMGTQSDYAFSAGNTYPAIALPWGMNFWTPQTGKMGDGWTYTYGAHTIRGFKQTHQPSPWINDYGQFALMPVRGKDKLDEESRQSWFSHQSETARPYYYSVYLADHDIRAELAPTERAAVMRFTFPESAESGVVIDAFDRGSRIETVDDRTIVGYTTRNSGGVPENFRNWFVVRFDKPFTAVELTDRPARYKAGSRPLYPEGGKAVEGNHAVAKVHFATVRGEQVIARVASSFISAEQALQNLKEVGEASFEEIRDRAEARWNEVLGAIEVSGGSLDEYRTFYSCLYRSVLFPRKFYEITASGEIVHYSPYNGEVLPGYMYTDTGFWDTFRALFPLLNLVYPSVNAEIQAGLANAWRESGFLPEWASPGHRGCMVGNNSASVVADAILKGITPEEDVETLYEAMMSGRDKVHPEVSSTGRLGHEYYNTLGYVPYNVGINENVARSLEYAYDDWCIARVARKLGRGEDAAKLERAAMNYRNLFDAETRLMRGRNADGTFQTPFSPYKWGDAFTEGNSWHYTWSVFHDPEGLATLMGGREAFARMLDSVFVVPPVYDDSYYGFRIHEITEMQVADMGNYAHGNQPAQHMIYLYDYAGQPWKAQWWAREVMDRLYRAQPDGYCGDEDNGQTSAWYVFSALGFYPVCPASDEYALGSPLFEKAVIHRDTGAEIVISAPGNAPDKRYVGSLTLDGKPWTHNFLPWADLADGADLRFMMQAEPNRERGTQEEDLPYSASRSQCR
ncbi:GH92 family glycosyl hydrolase [Alistipes sp.]|uniref:GH92 family glycosyl hydrolase n=1 Tax=Alistipes sp. TaxID=1872444 RepID=UPI0025BFE8BE|nr:GH92 family glycosyl hydrolase [Alistipes sp.]MCI7140934.1 GH92 family glycosyl hydrolase [Alistipes sp.]MDY5395978.1 GH92 family glycosyl hydrolase [Alistipes sp.]